MAATFGWKRTIACIFAVFNFYRKLTISAFVLGVSASEKSIKVAEIACSLSQIKMAEISINAETAKIYGASLRVAILICDSEQAISATLMDFSEALTPKTKAEIVNFR